jgi:hypothetical protein
LTGGGWSDGAAAALEGLRERLSVMEAPLDDVAARLAGERVESGGGGGVGGEDGFVAAAVSEVALDAVIRAARDRFEMREAELAQLNEGGARAVRMIREATAS